MIVELCPIYQGCRALICVARLSCSACYARSDNNTKGSHYWARTTRVFQDQNIIEFGENMAGVENPIVTSFPLWPVYKQLITA